MSLRRVYSSSFVAFKAVQCQSQIRLLNASAIALKDVNVKDQPNFDSQKASNANNDFNNKKQASGNLPLYVIGGVVVAGAAGYFLMGSKAGEDVKDKVAGKMLVHKANKEFENAKETVLKVAQVIGGKELADKVSKIIDEAKESAMKMAGDVDVSKTAGKVYRQGKETISNVKEHGISAYADEFEKIKDLVLKEAEKMGGKDLSKKASKVFDEAKDRIQKISSTVGEKGISAYAGEFENVKDYVLKETKKIGGDDLVKNATKAFEDAKGKLQSMAGNIGEHGLGDKEFEMVKDFVVKEAEKIGGKDLAKKAAKLMDEAKETIQKIAKELTSGDMNAGKAMQHVKDAVQKKVQ